MAIIEEKRGEFYLGKSGEKFQTPFFYDSKNLTTHAVCLGMTGSGKTGLGIGLLEEAALDKIPAIIIDPKGDLTNLLLTFPNLSAEEFAPWVDEAEADRLEISRELYAAQVARAWRQGLASFGESEERIHAFKKAVDAVIYTPASRAGKPISILSSFAVPPREVMEDSDALRDRIQSLTSSLLGLAGITADPIKSREHILIATIIDQSWKKGIDLTIPSLIQAIQRPPLERMGALDVETFFPQKERLALSIRLNNLLASPGFQAWMEGNPLDIDSLLFFNQKPQLSIFSIAHLSESERMFFVTLLLNELIAWMRKRSGTSHLKALLYMDEVFGYFPPTAMPPSKKPMLTLLKQARAYGLGIVLATQNPVDLDYKGLANCGTWFIGKLQTSRDIARVSEGLNAASNGEWDNKTLETLMSSIEKRQFIMRSIYEKEPLLFRTKWTLSYLRGPLTLVQIQRLMPKTEIQEASDENKNQRPMLSLEIPEFFLISKNKGPYHPQLLGQCKLHFVDTKNAIDQWEEVNWLALPDDNGRNVLWDKGEKFFFAKEELQAEPENNREFENLPPSLLQEKNYALFAKSFGAFLYQNYVLTFYRSEEHNLISLVGESEKDFRQRIVILNQGCNRERAEKLRQKYQEKIEILKNRLRSAEGKMEQRQQKAWWQKVEAALSMLTTFLGALFGGKRLTKGTITQAGTSLRRAGRISTENQNATRAEENYQLLHSELEEVQHEMEIQLAKATASIDPQTLKLQTVELRPRKSDIYPKIFLLWI